MGSPFLTDEFPRNGSNRSAWEINDGFLAVTLPIVYAVISIAGFFSNILALWVFYFRTQKTNSITVYMKNLAISDLLLSLCLPFRAAYNHRNYPTLCQVVGIVFYLTMYVSILLLSLICLDRYLKIIWPLRKFWIHTVPHSTTASRVVWLLCSTIMLCHFFETGNPKCFHFKSKSALGAALNMTAVVIFFLLLLFFLYAYCKISLKLYRVSLRKTQLQGKRASTRAVSKTFVVLAIFIVCFTPYHMVRVPYILAQVNMISDTWHIEVLHFANELVLCITALNCCFDPVIFFFLSSSFKRVMLAATHGKLKVALMKNHANVSPRKSISDSRIQRIEVSGVE